MEQIKDTGLMRPEYTKDGIPECSPKCPSKQGTTCKIQGCRPGLLCRPSVVVMAAELATLEPYRPLAKRADFKTVAGLLTGLCDFLMKAIEKPQQEWMTDFMTRTHDGKTHDLIRIWISHGKTPVERVAELIEGRGALMQKMVEWARDIDALDTDDAEFTDRALDRIAREMRGAAMPTEYPKRDTCLWSHDEPFNDDDNRYFTTSCKHDFIFNDGGPAENGFKSCPFCGKPIEVEELEEMLEEAGKC